MAMVLQSRSRRRPTPPSYYIISGESILGDAAAERLGVNRSTFDQRRASALKKLEPGQALTWEMLERK